MVRRRTKRTIRRRPRRNSRWSGLGSTPFKLRGITKYYTVGYGATTTSRAYSGQSNSFNYESCYYTTPYLSTMDQVKLVGVRVTFTPTTNVYWPSDAGVPQIAWVKDYDDSAPVNVTSDLLYDEWTARPRVRVHRFNKPLSIYIKPNYLEFMNDTIPTNNAVPAVISRRGKNMPWLNTGFLQNNTGVNFYGLKWVIQLPAPGVAQTGITAAFNYHVQYVYYWLGRDRL